ncbi:ABC transporter ATP-binding protein [Halopiger goleimassiliensis]|uniref:ABC transporter ATP-binding protein n=1 Tax=Halopiger goleimassiliensis TaxID=1293048 RepID=UPI000677A26F|nr:ABC transporter ATP-binding protein [Halopiger goleimassiliensis]
MSSISLRNVTKRFDDVTAIDGVELDVENGEFVVLVGPSGCGKSTLLRTIAGLESATAGSVVLDDEDVTDLDPADRDVAMVFQNYALYPHMTARRNMTFGLGSSGSDLEGEELDARVREVAEMLGIADLLDRKPAELSGGEKQRVAMGRALLRDPEVFLLDEPLSNLDAKLRDQMRTELLDLHRELGVTTVYVTHDQTEAMTLGDRIAVLNDGRIQQIDDPQQVYDYPENRFVAEFIGSPRMNVFRASLSTAGGRSRLLVDDDEIDLPGDPEPPSPADSRPVDVGIRPEDLSLADDDPGADAPLEVTVTMHESLGDSLLVYGTTGSQQLRFLTDPRRSIEPDDRVSLTVDRERIHLYDPETGEALYHSDPAASEPETASSDPVRPQP